MISSRDRYQQLTVDRQQALDKARRASKVTVYELIPEVDDPTPSNTFKNSYSSFGNDAVGSLTTKILYSVLPASQQFFRKEIQSTDFTEAEQAQLQQVIDGSGTLEEKIKRVLISNSKKIQNYFEEKGIRSTYNETIMHLIVAGNVVVKFTPEGARNYNLNNFVIVRDNESNTINELITKEWIFREELAQADREAIDEKMGGTPDEIDGDSTRYELYTHTQIKDDGNYTITQEIEGAEITRQDNVPQNELPFVAPRLYKNSDTNYGESYVYRFYDDLRDLNNYRRQLIQVTNTMCKIVWLVDPTGRAKPRDLAKKKAGEFAIGKQTDVTPLQINSITQVQVVQNAIDRIEEKLRNNFLMLTVRNSERTTAEEVRATQEELDQQLGGLFSTLSQELQLPSVQAVESIVRDNEVGYIELPGTHDRIVTGVEAIGRSQEVVNYRLFISLVAEGAQVKPELLDHVNTEYLAEQILKASGADADAMLPQSEVEQMRAARQQAQQQQMLQQQMLQSGGKMAEDVMNNTTKK